MTHPQHPLNAFPFAIGKTPCAAALVSALLFGSALASQAAPPSKNASPSKGRTKAAAKKTAPVIAASTSPKGNGAKTKTAAVTEKPKTASGKKLEPYAEEISGSLVKFDMVPIPGGEITVADPAKAGATRKVSIKPFWIGKTELPWEAYDVFAYRLDRPASEQAADRASATGSPSATAADKKAHAADALARPSYPYGAPDYGYGHHGFPTMSVTYRAAQGFCEWLSAKTGRKYRLPTEAEWEYAARAGATAPLTRKELDERAWHWDNADEKTHAVAKKLPNAWGLYDTLGNVGEWATGLDGKPVLRGGSYFDEPEKVHYGARALQMPAWNTRDPQNPKSTWWLSDGPFVGFRVVREP